nr:reverse transcriptase domain-containing protein [Tanacetum cinerariifolium]
MQTHSSSRLVSNPSSKPTSSTNLNPKGHNRRRSKQRIENLNLDDLSPLVVIMADQRTMAQLLQAPTEGYEDAIVVPAITADNFELKHGAVRIWLEKEPPRSIFTWDDLVLKFINQFFPSSKTTNLRNEITNFQQRFNESFSEAWDRFKDLLRACPHHAIIKSKSKVRYSRKKPVVAKSQNQSPAPVKAVEESCVTCDGAHSYRNCLATDGNVYRDNIQEFVSQASVVNFNQGNTSYRPPMMSNQIRPLGFPPAPAYQAPAPQTQGVSKEDFPAYFKANDAVLKNMQTQGQNMQNQLTNLTDLITNVSYDGPQILPPPPSLPKVVEDEPEATKDTVNFTNNGNTEDVQPQAVQSKSLVLISKPLTSQIYEPAIASKRLSLPDLIPTCMTLELADRSISRLVGVAEDVYVKVGSFYFPADFVVIDCDADLRVSLILRRSFLKTERALIDVFEGELTLRVGKYAITFNLDQTLRYSANYSDMTALRIDVIDMACEEYSQEVLGFSDTISSGNPTPYYDSIISSTSLTLTPFGNSDFLLEEGDILLLEAFINDDPSLPPLNQRNYLPEVRKELKICKAYYDKSSVDEPQVVELKVLPPHLEYAFLEGNDKLLVIITKGLSVKEKTALITVLKSHKRAIAWKLFDVKGINPEFCTHKILMEEDFEPAVQH